MQKKPLIDAPDWSSNLKISYTNEPASVDSTSISLAEHVMKMDLDDVEEAFGSSDVKNVESPGSPAQESSTVSE